MEAKTPYTVETDSIEVRFRNPVKALGFAQLQHVVTMDDQISDGAYRLYALYLMYAQDKTLCWPGRERIAQIRNVSEPTITRWNRELAAAGYITRQRRFNRTSITWIEDVEQNPRLRAIAERLFEQRKTEPNVPSELVQSRPVQIIDEPNADDAGHTQIKNEPTYGSKMRS